MTDEKRPSDEETNHALLMLTTRADRKPGWIDIVIKAAAQGRLVLREHTLSRDELARDILLAVFSNHELKDEYIIAVARDCVAVADALLAALRERGEK